MNKTLKITLNILIFLLIAGFGYYMVHSIMSEEKMVQSGDATIFVAEDEEGIIGFTIGGIVKSMEKMHCENIFVKETFRKQGIGDKLIEALIEEAKKQDLRYIVALTNKANKFYTRIGFEEGYEFTWYDLNLKREQK